MEVKAWKAEENIPTYEIGEPEKNPIFIEKRVYQGSSGKVYPHAVIDSIANEKVNKLWEVVYLENEYIKVMILPALGGRIQMAFDKTKQRHFIYYNQVIKPALVGLTGPWISGGIEFNWPQHHRPSTYLASDALIEKNKDGSQTVWCNEIELMFRTKGMIGFTLYPDKAYIELKVKLYNRTPHPQTFLWWANPAVKVNEHYQSIFPPDVHAVYDHGKRDVSEFPIAKGTYYKVNYAPATDISKYKNIPVPTSYMAVNSKYNFLGAFENDTQGGLLHIANHHISPGKKQWTWGHSDFGKAWDDNLTDEDGPYIELMCGVYTDNQPDFSWIMPYEERTFEQYFMPYRDLGAIMNASEDALLHLSFQEKQACIKVYMTADFSDVKILLQYKGENIFEDQFSFTPYLSYKKEIGVEETKGLWNYELIIFSKTGEQLINYQPEKNDHKNIPEPALPAKLPLEIEELEQLYLTGLHLEQYRHASFDPRWYYQEALDRSPMDVRVNTAYGLLLMRNGQFQNAIPHFENAIKTLTEKNPNPYDGEAYYHLGQCLKYVGEYEKAYAYFYKGTWNAAWQDACYFGLAQIDCINKKYKNAMLLIEKCLLRNWHHHKARALKISLLRKLGKEKEAVDFSKTSLEKDRFNLPIYLELNFLEKDEIDHHHYSEEQEALPEQHKEMWDTNINHHIEFALDYMAAHFFEEAKIILNLALQKEKSNLIVHYFMAFVNEKMQDREAAEHYFKKASTLSPEGCFPYRVESIEILNYAIHKNPKDSNAHYLLGNLWYDKRNYKTAIEHWETAFELNPKFPTTQRNLAIAYFNKGESAKEKALEKMISSFEMDKNNARTLLELDQLCKSLNQSLIERKTRLENNFSLVEKRDDLFLEYIKLSNCISLIEENKSTSRHLAQMEERTFHPWEGGEGKAIGQYILCHVLLGLEAMKEEDYGSAVDHFKACESYPRNLGEGKLYGAKENDIHYWIGKAYLLNKKEKESESYFQKAAAGSLEISDSVYYNDQSPDKIFYQGLAYQAMGNEKEARTIFEQLIAFGKSQIKKEISLDYFAVSLPDLNVWDADLKLRHEINGHYLMGLGYIGLSKIPEAYEQLQKVLKLQKDHVGALLATKILDRNGY